MANVTNRYLAKVLRVLRPIDAVTSPYGLSALRCIQRLRGMPRFRRELRTFKRLCGQRTDWPISRILPMLEAHTDPAGTAHGHYFHQDLHVARRIFENNPRRHVDIGSRIGGFVAHVAAFREIEVFDLRPLQPAIPNVRFAQLDLMEPVADDMRHICDSLSCLHALEHFGLGRYGDRIDPDGYLTGFRNMAQILEPVGTFYFSVPIGRQRIEFNAHRIFSVDHLLEMFEDHGFDLAHFSYVGDQGSLSTHVDLTVAMRAALNGLRYGCGIFELTKRQV